MALTICDVGPRDGLQNESTVLEPAVRAQLADRLAAAGVPRVEVASFVRAERVPQMAGAEEVVAALGEDGAEWSGLVLEQRGWERLVASGLRRANLTLAATDAFNRRNGNRSLEQALAGAEAIVAAADRPVTVTLSVAFGCPFEGRVDPGAVADLCARLAAAGADELVLADTIGVATPGPVRRLLERIAILGPRTGGHFHDTRHTGVACSLAAVEAGASLLDASVGGLGGCPFAPRATGNVATEDVVYALSEEGVDTGIDLDALVETAAWIGGVLGRSLPGGVTNAGGFPPAAVSSGG
jgi:hydroxymethylglutaryl-CoA lyase/(R)-citramalyl-CoA lyase